MAKAPNPPRGKASKPELHPLDPHLAALLNPALNQPGRSQSIPRGMAEAAQAGFAPEAVQGVDAALAAALGLPQEAPP
ncbi:MAG: hypothetical protein LDL25_03880, partial [Hyphomicrobiales bacterium]|nr:hypothetical protein [Hyphomicrobiales bacterium]